MGKAKLWKRVRGLEGHIEDHEERISRERTNPCPDEGLIRHWQVEIDAARRNLDHVLQRLGRR